ncbi:ribosome biogenesis protein brix, putative [Schistosoma mansoni]|uniref:ribosome biogenesis protein brix, putative n=1 Tax=Schistosoma mansoni TaxID=6183 RepID=UPI00022C8508|nr:ribosome biogenesis protein brix, putative [Schistosoma mansoni]|eukprot:XP_018646514.1 ribosome biogenesis protein brix, putative [Schistosoma mansoni]
MGEKSVKKFHGLKRKLNEGSKPKVSTKKRKFFFISIISLAKLLPSIRLSDQPPARKPQWTNRERVLIISSRGVSYIGRHLLKDLLHMMPHGKTDSKLDHKKGITVLNELAEMSNTNKVIYFEARKKKDLYLWLSCVPNGPSVKFLVENIRTTAELKVYQIAEESGALVEVGPRFSLNPIRIFSGSFCGAVLYSNPKYISPNLIRSTLLSNKHGKYIERTHNKTETRKRKKELKEIYPVDELDEIFE